MKEPQHIVAAHLIGADSWALLNFEQLPEHATVKKQVEALRADQRWQELKNIEISAAIDRLISSIEEN